MGLAVCRRWWTDKVRSNKTWRRRVCGATDCRGRCAGTAPTRTAPGYTKNFAFHYAFTPDNGWALYNVRTDPSCEHNFPKTGYYPWSTRNYYVNDWHAAFTAASLIEMQKQGVVYAIYTNPVAEAGGAGFDASGLMSPEHPWANLNVYRLWTKLAPDLVETTYDGRPGVFAQASRDGKGRVTLLLAHLRYRKDVAAELTVSLRGAPLPVGAKLTAYLIDDRHSNWHDAGPEHGELETVPPPGVHRGELTVTLPPRSAYLLMIEP